MNYARSLLFSFNTSLLFIFLCRGFHQAHSAGTMSQGSGPVGGTLAQGVKKRPPLDASSKAAPTLAQGGGAPGEGGAKKRHVGALPSEDSSLREDLKRWRLDLARKEEK